MKTTKSAWAILLLQSALFCAAALPPNDNFEDRIVLTGNDISFSGNASEATLQWTPTIPHSPCSMPGGDIWWSWTPIQDSEVVIKCFSTADKMASATSEISVWSGGNYPPDYVTCTRYDRAPYRHLFFRAIAGKEYHIRVTGGDGTNSFQFIAQPHPVLLVQPRSVTVAPAASAVFTAWPAGFPSNQVQWQFNGSDLPGETSGTLLLLDITTNQIGQYRAMVSSSVGTNFSDTAYLYVKNSSAPPTLKDAFVSNNVMGFTIFGEIGHSYRLESSTNLSVWTPEQHIVIATNGEGAFKLTNVASVKFCRVIQYSPRNELYNAKLKEIQLAKFMWANTPREAVASPPSYPSTPSEPDLLPFLKGNVIPNLPPPAGFAWDCVCAPPYIVASSTWYYLEEPYP